MVHNSSLPTSFLAISIGDENWVKGFFLLVPPGEQDDPTFVCDEFIKAQNLFHMKESNLLVSFDASLIHLNHLSGTNGRELSHWSCELGESSIFPFGPLSWSVFPSINWVSRHILGLNTHTSEIISCNVKIL